MPSPQLRLAELSDIEALLALEQDVFSSDRLSSRRFKHFIKSELSELWVMEGQGTVLGYALVLFHRGTSLARLYSLAIAQAAQGQGLGKILLEHIEQRALVRHVLFMRLEVRDDNPKAQHLYESHGYKKLRFLNEYYGDGANGWRMEKHLQRSVALPADLPFYGQTTPFTCGPSALLMVWRSLHPQVELSRIEELNIWREATTIYLTTGHGGTSPQGLALAALARGLKAELWLSHLTVPFLDGVRSEHKRELMQLVGEDFQRRCDEAGIPKRVESFTVDNLRAALQQGHRILLLISTWRLNRNKGPHWVWLVAMDDEFAYINDPDVDSELDQMDLDNLYVPVSLENLAYMIQYGSRRYTAAVLVR